MVETPNKYVTCYVKNGKVVDQHFLSSPDEVKTMEAVGRAKGYETETYVIDCCSLSEKSESVENDIAQSEEPSQQHKRPWNKWVKCIETGQVFPTVRECSNQMGIPYMTIINCIKNGNATRNYHFVVEYERTEAFRNMQNHTKKIGSPPRKIICVTTGKCYESVKDCLRECHLPVNSFYRALHSGSFIKGLLFRYAE